MSNISIGYIESAINAWRKQKPADTVSCTICPEANALADVYGLMIFHKLAEIPTSELSVKQQTALTILQL